MQCAITSYRVLSNLMCVITRYRMLSNIMCVITRYRVLSNVMCVITTIDSNGDDNNNCDVRHKYKPCIFCVCEVLVAILITTIIIIIIILSLKFSDDGVYNM
jgi:hypothetical protein